MNIKICGIGVQKIKRMPSNVSSKNTGKNLISVDNYFKSSSKMT